MANNSNNKILGELEKKVMEVVWRLEKASVRDVLNEIQKNNKPAYTTIMTVMARLHKKGLLRRKLKEDAYIYTPSQNKRNFFSTVAKNVINGLINEFGEDVAVAQFIDYVEKRDTEKSREWKRKLKKIIDSN